VRRRNQGRGSAGLPAALITPCRTRHARFLRRQEPHWKRLCSRPAPAAAVIRAGGALPVGGARAGDLPPGPLCVALRAVTCGDSGPCLFLLLEGLQAVELLGPWRADGGAARRR
jgi:hypothetical protein